LYGFTARLAILLAELRELQPAQQRPRSYAANARRVVDASLRQERGDRFFLFPPEFPGFPAIRCHLVPSAAGNTAHRRSFASRDSLHN
jgi:hypothetical protein